MKDAGRKLLVLGVGSACALLGGELILRGIGWRDSVLSPSARVQFADMYEPVFRRVERGGRDVFETTRPRMAPGVFAARKEPGRRRVFILGSSTAQNFPINILRDKLRQVLPGADWEIVNCGMAGFDAYRTLRVGAEVLEHDPDLLIVIVGNSEFFGPRRFCRWKLLKGLSHSRLFARLCDWIDPPVVVRSQAEADRYYSESLTRLILQAKRRGVALLLCTLPVNYRHNQFFGAPDIRASPTMLCDGDFIRLLEASRRRERRRARACLEALAARYPKNALIEYYAAVIAELEGRFDEAGRHYERALALNPWPVSCTAERNELIRALAARHDLPLADVARRFRELAPRGLPGFEVFRDNSHVWPSGYGLYADAVIDGLLAYNRRRGAAALAPSPQWKPDALVRTSYAQVCADVALRKRYQRRMDGRLGLAQGLAVIIMSASPIDPTGLQFLQSLERAEPALLSRAAEKKGEWRAWLSASPWISDALPYFEEKWDKALLHVAETLRRAGRYEEALPVFDAVIARQDGFEARCWRGWTLRALGREREAQSDFAAACGIMPALAGRL